MSWNGNVGNPNWAGNDNEDGNVDVGDLYIVPTPATITENPSIGLEERNEVALPTKYKDFDVANLTATDIQADDITADNITATDITATNINGNPNFDASNWSLFLAINDVRGTLGLFSIPLYSISDFLNITCANNITSQGGSITAALQISAGVSVGAPLGSFNTVNAENIQVSFTNETAAVDIYGASLVAGNNALYVEGGTTLTGGGVVHGVVIGALQVAGIDTVRIDVLPVGMTLTSATFIATTAAGAASLVAGGALALAGGDYISYNSDKHTFINTTDGNDNTEMYIGQIHAAENGSLPLRINDAGRGVELANVNSMTMTTQLAGVLAWSNATTYAIGNKVRIAGNPAIYYNAVLVNKNLLPNIPIPNWVSASNYVINNVVFSGGLVYRCSANISGSTTPPASVSDPNWTNLGFTTNNITQFWTVFTPSVANITGDDVSNITIGKITAPVDYVKIAGTGLQGTTGLESITNINNLTLTSTIGSPWNVANIYADGDKVEYDNGNWISQFNDNRGNIPDATLQNWVSGDGYDVGNVRYYATNNKAYLCNTAITIGTTTPPPSDAKWTEFQTGSNGEDVWFPTTAPVVSSIIGDRVSGLEIGTISCVNDGGSYLEITEDVDSPYTQNALVQSAGLLGLIGDQGVQIGATNGDANVISLVGGIQLLADDPTNGAVAITGNTLVGLSASVGNIVLEAQADVNIEATTGDATITSTAGGITLASDLATTITSNGGEITLSSQEATNITSTANAVILTGSTGVNINSPDAITLTSSTTDVIITSTLGDVDITAGNNINITAGAGDKVIVNSILDLNNNNVIDANTITGQGALTLATTGATNLNLSPDTGGLIVANKGLNLNNNNITNANTITGQTTLSLASTNGNVNLTAGGTGNRINFNSNAQFNNNTLFNFTGTNVGGIYGLTTAPLVLVGQQATPAVQIRGSLTMWQNASTQGTGNSISGITTLNGRNIFSYGNFYNTATQTLGAINTATRVVMNTAANNNLITLDTTTNIGRITFTNAGVYKVVWNAYLLHGSGGSVKSCIWIRLNGTDVAGSGKTENNDSQLNETNLTSSSLINATAGQYIEFFWASDSVNVPLTAVAASSPFPATPSFNCTITIVG